MTPQAASHADPEDRRTPSRSDWVAVDAATIPAKLARELRDAWEGFVDGHTLDRSEDEGTPPIRNPIAASWRRSRDAGVDPHGRQNAPSLMELPGARASWDSHPLAIAAPLIDECMSAAAVDADHLMVISDASGMLLSIRGDITLRSRAADEMNFIEGALWSEAGAGTNAVGTAVAAGHAVQVFAAEHFHEPVQRWTCSAAPIFDPDGGALLGIIDVTGDISAVQPHSLAVVVATAQAVEGFLRDRLHERDDRLRERYARHLVQSGAALVSGSGRMVFGREPHWHADDFVLGIPAGGGGLVLPSGRHAVAEPVGDDDVYVVRPDTRRAGERRRMLQLTFLGPSPEVRLDGEALTLRPRHLELLALLAARRSAVSADVLCTDLYGERGSPASVRVEMSRLRRLLGGAVDPDQYRLACTVDADFARVRALLSRSQLAEATASYPGPLLPDSTAPGVERERDGLEGWLRHAVVTGEDVEALWAWVATPSGDDDLLAWQRLLTLVDYADPRRSRIAARTAALRRALA
jgi:hypothetical protein